MANHAIQIKPYSTVEKAEMALLTICHQELALWDILKHDPEALQKIDNRAVIQEISLRMAKMNHDLSALNQVREAMGFRRVAVQKDNVVYPVEFQCDICGDYHESDDVPRMCETGDGE